MRIGIVGPVYPFRGGIAHHTAQLAQALAERRLRLRPGPLALTLRHTITRHRIRLFVIDATLEAPPTGSGWRWLSPARLDGAPLTGTARRILSATPCPAAH